MAAACSVILGVHVAIAGPPVEGVYSSTAGDMLNGRGSESWPGGSDLAIGDALHWESWDGSTLGSEWYIECPEVCVAPLLIVDTVISGNGFQIWQSQYCGGELWLNADNGEPWSNGESEYVVEIDNLTQITTIQFVGGAPVAWITDMNMLGLLPDFGGDCIDLFLSNTERIGDTESGTFPADYPGLVAGADCDAADVGSAWNVHDITMSIIGPCGTPVEPVSWGEIKNVYR
jgi:hypothetical protein